MRRIFLIIFSLLISGFLFGQDIKKVKITDLEKMIKASERPLIIDFWATWCKPCLEEIPVLIQEVKKQNALAKTPVDSIQLVLVSLDFQEMFPIGISDLVKKRKFKATFMWLDETNADYFCPKIDPKWSGAIPATLFVNKQTGYRNFFEEKLSEEKLKQEIMAILEIH